MSASKFKILIRNLIYRLLRDHSTIDLINTRSVLYDYFNHKFSDDPSSKEAMEFIETVNNNFTSIYGQPVLSLDTFYEFKQRRDRGFYTDFSPENQGDSKSEQKQDIDQYMLELLNEFRESKKKEQEKANAPQLLIFNK